MSGVSQIIFIAKHLSEKLVSDRTVIDVGSFNYNGSAKPLIEWWKPRSYLGVDLIAGPGVDKVVNADQLVTHFGEESFDIVMSMEMLEHSPQWWLSIQNMKQICKRGGLIVLSTRSQGYPCHGFPNDYWRFEIEDMQLLFNDCEILALEKDPFAPGVFIIARKHERYVVHDERSAVTPYSIAVGRRVKELPVKYKNDPYYRRLALKQRIKNSAAQLFITVGKVVSRVLRLRA